MVEVLHTLSSKKNSMISQMFYSTTLMHLFSQQFRWNLPRFTTASTIRMKKKNTKEKALEVPVRMFKGATIRNGKKVSFSSLIFLTAFSRVVSSSLILVASMAAWSNCSALSSAFTLGFS